MDIKNDTGMLEYYAYIMFNMFADDTDTVTDFLKRGCAMPGYWPTPSRQIERIAHRVGWTKTRNCQTPNHNKKREKTVVIDRSYIIDKQVDQIG